GRPGKRRRGCQIRPPRLFGQRAGPSPAAGGRPRSPEAFPGSRGGWCRRLPETGRPASGGRAPGRSARLTRPPDPGSGDAAAPWPPQQRLGPGKNRSGPGGSACRGGTPPPVQRPPWGRTAPGPA
ncbi:Enamine/imine deaminase, partial [Dysosmobacter welbionis]